MKNLFLMFCLAAITYSGFSQIYTDLPDDAVLSLDNVECTGTMISFDMSLTYQGIPLTIDGSNDIIFGNANGSEVYFQLNNEYYQEPVYDFTDGDVLDMFPFSTMLLGNFTCMDLIGIPVYMNRYASTNMTALNATPIIFFGSGTPGRFSDILEFDSAPIPTLGQWGLIILGISLLIGGIIAVRRNVFA